MDKLPTIDTKSLIARLCKEKMQELLSGDFHFLPYIKTPRAYQTKIMQKTIADMKAGNLSGRWDIGVGAGKTFMALSLADHIVKNGGKVLVLAPGNVDLDNMIAAHRKYSLGLDNYLIFSEEKDITTLKYSDTSSIAPAAYHYGTPQMMIYDKRYEKVPRDYFDLIIFDEAQGYLGDVFSNLQEHFMGTQLHMSATPFTMQRHVGDLVPHVYGSITSKELIDDYGFPKWHFKNYEVDDTPVDITLIKDGELDFEDPRLHNSLNIAQRFSIIELICEEILLDPSRKGIVYMPSVRDLHLFHAYIAQKNPLLTELTNFVAGVRTKKKNREIIEALRNRSIVVIFSKNLLNQALDIPEITDIVLGDPSGSLRILLQRIGRGARPAPGKLFVNIHDLVSSVYHSHKHGAPAIRADSLMSNSINSESATTRNFDTNGSSMDITKVNPLFIRALRLRRIHDVKVTSNEVNQYETLIQARFMADPKIAKKAIELFASESLHISYAELILNIRKYINSEAQMSHEGNTFTLQDLLDTARFYGTYDECVNIDPFASSIKALSKDDPAATQKSRQQEQLLESIIIPTKNAFLARNIFSQENQPEIKENKRELIPKESIGQGKFKESWLVALNTLLTKIPGVQTHWTYKTEYSKYPTERVVQATVTFLLPRNNLKIEVTSDKWFHKKQHARHAAAKMLTDKIKESLPNESTSGQVTLGKIQLKKALEYKLNSEEIIIDTTMQGFSDKVDYVSILYLTMQKKNIPDTTLQIDMITFSSQQTKHEDINTTYPISASMTLNNGTNYLFKSNQKFRDYKIGKRLLVYGIIEFLKTLSPEYSSYFDDPERVKILPKSEENPIIDYQGPLITQEKISSGRKTSKSFPEFIRKILKTFEGTSLDLTCERAIQDEPRMRLFRYHGSLHLSNDENGDTIKIPQQKWFPIQAQARNAASEDLIKLLAKKKSTRSKEIFTILSGEKNRKNNPMIKELLVQEKTITVEQLQKKLKQSHPMSLINILVGKKFITKPKKQIVLQEDGTRLLTLSLPENNIYIKKAYTNTTEEKKTRKDAAHALLDELLNRDKIHRFWEERLAHQK